MSAKPTSGSVCKIGSRPWPVRLQHTTCSWCWARLDNERQSYRLWEEPRGPDFVLEVTSRRTWREDQGRKRKQYEMLGVPEYWQYDPTGDYLQP